MLQFFRKYQKIFFVIVAIFVIASFSFFGTFNTMVPTEVELPDSVLGKAADGSPLSSREVEGLRRFIATSAKDLALLESGKAVNLMNDGVVQEHFLQGEIASLIAEKYAEQILPDLQERMQKIREFQPYSHPQATFIRQDELWKRFHPQIYGRLSLLKERADGTDISSFSLLSALYLDQLSFPSSTVRRILSYQESQYPWVQKDPELNHRTLSICGFETLEEWLGPRFLDVAAQFITNAARLAEKRGCKVSKREVRQELFRNARLAMKRIDPKHEPSDDEARSYMQRTFAMLGIQESHALDAWRSVMLFRLLLTKAGEKAIAAMPETPLDIAPELAHIVLYELPSHLRFSNFLNALQFQFYIDAVRKERGDILSLPEQFLSVDEIEREFPELVQRRYKIEWQGASQEKIIQGISLKETWEWELQEKNWEKMQEQFPLLAKEKTREARFHLLDKMGADERFKIDQFARDAMMAQHPEWINEALHHAPKETREISVRLRGGDLPFHAAVDQKELLAKLEKGEPFSIQSIDQKSIFRISVLERGDQKELLSFEDAQKEGTLGSLLDKKLELAYEMARKSEPSLFKQEDGSWKDFKDVKEFVGAIVYKDLLRAIEEDCKARGEPLPSSEKRQPLQFYANRRLAFHVQKEKELYQRDEKREVVSPWKLIKTERDVAQKDRIDFEREPLYSLSILSFSPLSVSQQGNVSFFQLLDRTKDEKACEEEREKQKAVVRDEARHELFVQLLNEIVQKKAICLK